MANYIEVMLPLPVKALFTYQVADKWLNKIHIGKRVLVPFGRTEKLLTGLIVRQYSPDEALLLPQQITYRFIDSVLDEYPVVPHRLLVVYQWISSYYLCSQGEVMNASLPADFKLESQLTIQANPNVDLAAENISEKEYILLEALTIKNTLTLSEITQIISVPDPRAMLRRMQQKGLIQILQQVNPTYKPKYKKYLKLAEAYTTIEGLKVAFDMVKRNPKQEEALMLIIDAYRQRKSITEKEITEKLQISNSVIKSLIDKQLIEILQIPIDRISDFNYRQVAQNFVPTAEQQQAINTINDIIDKNTAAVILLHGITGSGKTWVYIEIMRQILAQDKQILYLLPEIGLTTQIIDRLKSVFGDTVGVYHSRFSSAERVEIWQKILLGHYRIIIGVRSAMLLPFEELGLIIVDEEHDHSFKQHDPAPRYHARDLAVWYGRTFSIPVILGSATPSIESYENATSGKYTLVEMKTRAIANAKLPEIQIVDMRTQIKHKLSYGLFSDILIEALTQTLARKEQAILFRNRRGYAPYLVCENCGHIPKCEYCDIRLTYHKKEQYLRCHYCGYTDSLTDKCANCGNYSMKREGIGTERIEEQLQSLFPQARIQRMDQDTTRGKSGHRNIIEQLERHQIDFLVGTQMVTKGLDFENVTLVAVLDADRLIFFPDFRSHETAYQILVQFSGRAGRSNKQGKVLIQTRNPEHPVITLLSEPFSAFYENELAYRMAPNYPPYSRLIRLEFQHKDQLFLEKEAQKIGKALQNEYNNWVIGPEFADVARVKNYYRMFILIKVNKKYAVTKVKKGVENILDAYRKTADDKTLKIIIDVDPY